MKKALFGLRLSLDVLHPIQPVFALRVAADEHLFVLQIDNTPLVTFKRAESIHSSENLNLGIHQNENRKPAPVLSAYKKCNNPIPVRIGEPERKAVQWRIILRRFWCLQKDCFDKSHNHTPKPLRQSPPSSGRSSPARGAEKHPLIPLHRISSVTLRSFPGCVRPDTPTRRCIDAVPRWLCQHDERVVKSSVRASKSESESAGIAVVIYNRYG